MGSRTALDRRRGAARFPRWGHAPARRAPLNLREGVCHDARPIPDTCVNRSLRAPRRPPRHAPPPFPAPTAGRDRRPVRLHECVAWFRTRCNSSWCSPLPRSCARCGGRPNRKSLFIAGLRSLPNPLRSRSFACGGRAAHGAVVLRAGRSGLSPGGETCTPCQSGLAAQRVLPGSSVSKKWRAIPGTQSWRHLIAG